MRSLREVTLYQDLYVKFGYNLAEISKIYNIPLKTLENYRWKKGWKEKRAEYFKEHPNGTEDEAKSRMRSFMWQNFMDELYLETMALDMDDKKFLKNMKLAVDSMKIAFLGQRLEENLPLKPQKPSNKVQPDYPTSFIKIIESK